ncbi:tryptophan aminotransferase-related protein 3-like protein [Tanacetum coccineum]
MAPLVSTKFVLGLVACQVSCRVGPSSDLDTGSCTRAREVMIFCTIKSKPLALPWGRTPRLDSGVRSRKAEFLLYLVLGHGLEVPCGSTYEGEPVCECYDVYVGATVLNFLLDGLLMADSGDPIFLEPFWMQHAADSAVVISGWHRMSYRYADYTGMSIELEKYIRKMHSIVGNAVTEGRYLVFGVGSSQLLNAAVYALSSDNSSTPSNVLASIPFYPVITKRLKYIFRNPDSVFTD